MDLVASFSLTYILSPCRTSRIIQKILPVMSAMANEFSNQQHARKSVRKRQKGLCQILIGRIRLLFSCLSRNNSAVVDQSPLDPSLEAVSSPKHKQHFKGAADPVHTSDHADLLGEAKKTLQTEDVCYPLATLPPSSGLDSPSVQFRELDAHQSAGRVPKGEAQGELNQRETLLTEDLDEKFMQLEKEKSQQILMSIEQSLLQNPPMVRLEENVMKLKKELSEMEMANQIMKTQLRKVIHIHLVDFRESVTKMMGFNIKIPDKEITNQFWPPINPYGINYV
ncbi:uncharacterized protein LOC110204209 isoform X1 [Phascolarctos cinereus]|uniref:Uncharacterized protein LOC110204042 isoform X1 n=2 Tax=Phascolarctos cinereus TaxID=38626 RepID=A0A6P5JP54_PHACI|nr:uncharacterized protein LOC110204042 isoform X1 [Phascolarctos cinereus]XP_020836146.1 uncharacterized protein LOC110204209 isoform X1 [Phascolarctos cinereus]